MIDVAHILTPSDTFRLQNGGLAAEAASQGGLGGPLTQGALHVEHCAAGGHGTAVACWFPTWRVVETSISTWGQEGRDHQVRYSPGIPESSKGVSHGNTAPFL